jgi:hypothetical protein
MICVHPCTLVPAIKGVEGQREREVGAIVIFRYAIAHYCTTGMSATAGMPETLETPVAEGMSTPEGAARADALLDTARTQHQQQKEL